MVCGGRKHTAEQCPSPCTAAPEADDGTSRPLRGVDREYKKRGTSDDERPPQSKSRGTKRAPSTVWAPELGPCRNEDAAGKCGKNHLHKDKDCLKRAAANAAAAAKKAAAGAQAYVEELHSRDDSVIYVEIPACPPLPAKPAPVLVATAVANSATAAAVGYIDLAL
jgi:hypothetical protein